MDARPQLVNYYYRLRSHGLNDSHSGNASIRDGETVWITPSGAAAENLRPADLVACALDGSVGGNASLDAPLHVAVYQSCATATAVLHSHGPYSVAMTLDGVDFKPVDFEGVLYFQSVPVINLPYDEYLQKSAAAVAEKLAHHPITVYRGHGVYARGESLDQAYKWTCSLEHSAHIAWLARVTGKTS